MRSLVPRFILEKPCFFRGIGLHSGCPCEVDLLPQASSGISFRLGSQVFPVTQARFRGDGRGTVLSFPDGQEVHTVEHILAALAGLGLDGVTLQVRGEEIPAMDGSAEPFVRGLLDAGVRRDGVISALSVESPLAVDDLARGRSVLLLPHDGFRVTYVIDYPGTAIGCQALSVDVTGDTFKREIACCRTFALMDEVQGLREMGLSLGGSLENAVVVDQDRVLADGGLRFTDEFVRHKILDLIGDLALLGRPVLGHVIALKAGHQIHQKLVCRIKVQHEMEV